MGSAKRASCPCQFRSRPETFSLADDIAAVQTIGFGFLAGIDVYDCVLVLRNRKAVEAFARPKISLGAEVAIAAGPVGNGFVLDAGVELAPVLVYTKVRLAAEAARGRSTQLIRHWRSRKVSTEGCRWTAT